MKYLKNWRLYLLLFVGVLVVGPMSLWLFTSVIHTAPDPETISAVETLRDTQESTLADVEQASTESEEQVEQVTLIEETTSVTNDKKQEISTFDLAYQLTSAEWRPYVLNYWPDANFLVLWVNVTNTGKKPVRVGTFKLVSETGSEYAESEHAGLVQKHWDKYTDINPEVTKEGLLIFDVPKNHKYTLHISHEEDRDPRVIEISEIKDVSS